MIPAIAAAAVRGFVGATATFDRATNLYAKTTEKTDQFISSIAKNSPQVQFGQAQAEIIKLKADLASDKIGGKEFKNYLVQSANTDATFQKISTYFTKWSAQILTVLNKILDAIASLILPYLEAIDKWLDEWWEMYLKTVKDIVDTFRWFLTDEFAARWITWANEEEAKLARERMPEIVPELRTFFSNFVPMQSHTPGQFAPKGI